MLRSPCQGCVTFVGGMPPARRARPTATEWWAQGSRSCQRLLVGRLEDVSDCRAPCSADALSHAQPGIYLVGPGLASQLLDQLHDLIDSAGAQGIAPRLQASHGADRNASFP